MSVEAPGCFDGYLDFVRDWAAKYQVDEVFNYTSLSLGKGVAAFGGQWTVGDLRLFNNQ